MVERLAGAQIAITNRVRFDQAVISQLPDLQREYAVITSQVDARVGHECRQPGDKVQWLEHNMRRAIPIRRLQSVVAEPLGGERETFCADGRSRDGAALPFEFVALVGGGDHAGMQREPIGPRGRALVIT